MFTILLTSTLSTKYSLFYFFQHYFSTYENIELSAMIKDEVITIGYAGVGPIIADAPSGSGFIMTATERQHVLRLHRLLILLASQTYSYGGLHTPCSNRVLLDSLGLLDHSEKPRESVGRRFFLTSYIIYLN